MKRTLTLLCLGVFTAATLTGCTTTASRTYRRAMPGTVNRYAVTRNEINRGTAPRRNVVRNGAYLAEDNGNVGRYYGRMGVAYNGVASGTTGTAYDDGILENSGNGVASAVRGTRNTVRNVSDNIANAIR